MKKFFAENGGDWPVFDSDQGRTALDWGVARVPESYLVSPSGTVVARFVNGVTRVEINRVMDKYTGGSDSSEGGS